MQTAEQEEQQQDQQPVTPPPTEPQSQPHLATSVGAPTDEDDPEIILANAIAAIETQPLAGTTRRTYRFSYVLEDALCLSMVLIGIAGIVWQLLTYPHTLVVLVTPARPAALTSTLTIPTRTLAPLTLTRAATVATTGWGHQQATAASGTLTFYNGTASQQTIARGTVFTSSDGVQVSTAHTISIPAANPPVFGQAAVPATTVQTGSRANLPALALNETFSDSLFVKNLTPFTGGRGARTYRAVAAHDLATATSTVNEALTAAFPTAFPLQPGEAAMPTHCHASTGTTHQVGEEASSVSVTIVRTCSAVAYSRDVLSRAASAAFTKTRPAAPYHLVGGLQTTVTGVSPLTVSLRGRWAYTFTADDEQRLAQAIQGESPAQARTGLLKTGVISYASIPNTLPAAMYINFVVLVG